MKIFDAHAHIFPDRLATKAAENILDFYKVKMADITDGIGTAAQLLSQARVYGVSKILICSVALNIRAVSSINDFMASKLVDKHFIPLGALHPDMETEHIKDEIARISELCLYGVKLHPDFQNFKLAGDKAHKIFDALQGFCKPILVHTGDKRMDNSHPRYMVEIAKDYPHLQFIAAHLGGWSQWEHAEEYSSVQNVMFDTSSTLSFLDEERAREIILGLGVRRFMFGTDYPMWQYNTEIDKVLKLGFSQAENELLFYENAAKLFGVTEDRVLN